MASFVLLNTNEKNSTLCAIKIDQIAFDRLLYYELLSWSPSVL